MEISMAEITQHLRVGHRRLQWQFIEGSEGNVFDAFEQRPLFHYVRLLPSFSECGAILDSGYRQE